MRFEPATCRLNPVMAFATSNPTRTKQKIARQPPAGDSRAVHIAHEISKPRRGLPTPDSTHHRVIRLSSSQLGRALSRSRKLACVARRLYIIVAELFPREPVEIVRLCATSPASRPLSLLRSIVRNP